MKSYGPSYFAERYLRKARQWADRGCVEIARGYLNLARGWVDKMPEVT